MLTVAGLHEPVIPLSDVPGNVGTAAPAHIERDVPKLNTGVTFGFTVTLKLAVVAHWLPFGVKV